MDVWTSKVGRALGGALRRALGRNDPLILMYHRVADVRVDPWDLAVHPARFDEQMDVVSRTRMPVPIDWLVGEISAGRRPQKAVAVTFDDGYLDVLRAAKPVLEKHDVPATMFLTTGTLGAPYGFWWDRLSEAVLTVSAAPDRMRLSFAEVSARDRHELHLALWRTIRVLGPTERERAVDEVAHALGTAELPRAPVMNRDEVRELATGGLVTIGAHSVSHPSLPSLSDAEQQREMEESRNVVEDIVGEPVRRFAYPFGDFDERAERLARTVGFDFAVSTLPGVAVSRRELFRLPRYAVGNWGGERFEAALRSFV